VICDNNTEYHLSVILPLCLCQVIGHILSLIPKVGGARHQFFYRNCQCYLLTIIGILLLITLFYLALIPSQTINYYWLHTRRLVRSNEGNRYYSCEVYTKELFVTSVFFVAFTGPWWTKQLQWSLRWGDTCGMSKWHILWAIWSFIIEMSVRWGDTCNVGTPTRSPLIRGTTVSTAINFFLPLCHWLQICKKDVI
jgi:hypothetical protein